MTLLEIANDFFASRDIVNTECMLERAIASVACHILGLVNVDLRLYRQKGQLWNTRLQVGSIAPSGFGKTLTHDTFLDPESGLCSLSKELFGTVQKGTFSQESWLGTIRADPESGELKPTGGVFDNHKRDIVSADEFQRMAALMTGDGLMNDEVYLLGALSKDWSTKDLAFGSIRTEGICTTLWFGMRPVVQDKTSGVLFNLSSGLVRRCLFQYFFPSRLDAERFNQMADRDDMKPVGASFDRSAMVRFLKWSQALDEQLRGDPPTWEWSNMMDWFRQHGIQHFDRELYKRIAMGLTLAQMDKIPQVITPKAQDIKALIHSELKSRRALRKHIYDVVAYHIVVAEEGQMTTRDFKTFLEDVYQYTNYQASQVVAQAKGKSRTIEMTPDGTLTVSEEAKARFEQ